MPSVGHTAFSSRKRKDEELELQPLPQPAPKSAKDANVYLPNRPSVPDYNSRSIADRQPHHQPQPQAQAPQRRGFFAQVGSDLFGLGKAIVNVPIAVGGAIIDAPRAFADGYMNGSQNQNASNVQWGIGYNSRDSWHGNRGFNGFISGNFNNHGRTYRQPMSASGGETGGLLSRMLGGNGNRIENRADGYNNTDFFKSDTYLYTMVGEGQTPSMRGAKNSIFDNPREGNAEFIKGYNNTLGQYRILAEKQQLAEQNGATYPYPETAEVRQELCAAVFGAVMNHAERNPDFYPESNTNAAAQSYRQRIGNSWDKNPLPPMSNSAIVNLQKAFGDASDSDPQTLELAKIVAKFRQSQNEAEFNYQLINFSTGRSALVQTLDSSEATLHKSLAQMPQLSGVAESVRQTLVSQPDIWNEKAHGVVTKNDNAFGVFQENGNVVLRMKLEGQDASLPISPEHYQKVFEAIGQHSVKGSTDVVSSKEMIEQISGLVKDIPDNAQFTAALENAKSAIEGRDKAAADKIAQDKQAKIEAEKQLAEAKKQLPQVEAQIATVTAERTSAETAKAAATKAVETAKAELVTAQNSAKAKLEELKPSAWSILPPVAAFNYVTGAADKNAEKLEALKTEMTAKKDAVAKAEENLKTATGTFAEVDTKLAGLKQNQIQLLAQAGEADNALAATKAAEAQAKELAGKETEAEKTTKAGSAEAFVEKVITICKLENKDAERARQELTPKVRDYIENGDDKIITNVMQDFRKEAIEKGKNDPLAGLGSAFTSLLGAPKSPEQLAKEHVDALIPQLRQAAIQTNIIPQDKGHLISQNDSQLDPVKPFNIQQTGSQQALS